MSFFISGLLVLTCFSTLLDKDYDYGYAMKQLPKEILDELKKDGDDNLFTIDMFTVSYGYKAFYLGAYPLNVDEESISNIINNYGLDKFIVAKYNTWGTYVYESTLYKYLKLRDSEYELVYDSDTLCYFRKR